MKKIYNILFLISLFFANILLATNEFQLNLTHEEKQYLKTKKVIKMCVDPNWMPFEKIEDNTHIGIASDYMKIISHKLNTPINFVKTKTWMQSIEKAKNRECDIFSLVGITPDRKKYMNFTSPYIKTPIVMATRLKELYIDDFTKVLDKTFVVVEGYSLEVFLKQKFPNIKIIHSKSIEAGLKSVENGDVFACIDNLVTINYMIQKEFIGILNISGRIDIKIPYRIATRNDEAILNDIFQKALNSINTIQKEHIFNKWVLVNDKKKINYSLIWKIIAAFSLIFFIILYFLIKQNKLKKEIEDFNLNLQKKVSDSIQEIQEKNSYFKNILDATVEMIVFYNEDKIITDINTAGVEMLNYTMKSEIIGRNIMEFIAPNQLEKVQEAMQKDIAKAYELILVKKDKSLLPIIISARNITKDNQKLRILTIMDITNIKNQQKIIHHQSKLAKMGEMISMIAHQWRQPLNAISVTSSNLQFKCMMDNINKDFFEQELKLIDKYSQHLSKTIDDFRDFFKENKEKTMTSLIKVVNDTLDIVSVSLEHKNITIITKIECNLEFMTYENELKQVVLNLLKNAEDILLEKKIKNPTISIFTLCDAQNCKNQALIIKDNGGGISEDIMMRIFEPYFSTKKEKDGTGLGLYMSKIIIEEHCGGKLTVSNDKDGAVFKMQFL